MDLVKIGQFIAKKRKEKNLTQSELAKELFVTDRAVSKWECGRSLPDSTIMLVLCKILGITVNELLSGEELDKKEYDKTAEENILRVVKQKEESDKRLLKVEIVIGIIGTFFLFTMLAIGILTNLLLGLPLWAMIIMFAVGFIVFFVAVAFAILIEQKAGYYECKECGHRYVPTYWQVLFAPHINRDRYMKCPKCGKRSYQKKVISEKE